MYRLARRSNRVEALFIALLAVSAAHGRGPAVATGSKSAGIVLVTERAGTTVAKIDPATDQVLARVSLGGMPSAFAVDHRHGWVYVSLHTDNKIAAVKPDTLEAADVSIPGLGTLPIGVSLTPDFHRLLVATRGADGMISSDDRLDVVEMDTSSWPPVGTLTRSIPTGQHPIAALVSRDGRYAVLTVRNQPAILIVDLNTYQVTNPAPDLPPTAEPEGGDVHPSSNIVYITLHGPMSTIEIIDLDTLTLVRHVPIVCTPPARPSTGAFTPDGARFYVSGQAVNKMLMFDTSDPYNPVQSTSVQLPVGPQPHFIAYLPDGRAYVANTNNGQPYGSLSIIHDYLGTPTISGPILTDLAGPLGFANFTWMGPGDLDHDSDVDAQDMDVFTSCSSGPAIDHDYSAACQASDFDQDHDVDQTDFGVFQRCLSGAGTPVEADCAD